MKKPFLAVVLACLVLASGCAGMTPRQRLMLNVKAYAATLQTLAEYREAGRIDTETAAAVEKWSRIARSALNQWYAAIQRGESAARARSDFERAVGMLEGVADELMKQDMTERDADVEDDAGPRASRRDQAA